MANSKRRGGTTSSFRYLCVAVALLAYCQAVSAEWEYGMVGDWHFIGDDSLPLIAFVRDPQEGVFGFTWEEKDLHVATGETLIVQFDTGATYTSQVVENAGIQSILLPLEAGRHFALANSIRMLGSQGQLVTEGHLKGTLRGWNTLVERAGIPEMSVTPPRQPDRPKAESAAADLEMAKPLVDPKAGGPRTEPMPEATAKPLVDPRKPPDMPRIPSSDRTPKITL